MQPTASESRPSSTRSRPIVSTSRMRRAPPVRTGRRPTRSTGLAQYADGVPILDLPVIDRPPVKSYRSGREHRAYRRRAVRGAQEHRGDVAGNALRDAARCVRGADLPPLRTVGLRHRHRPRRPAEARQPAPRRALREHRSVASQARARAARSWSTCRRCATTSPRLRSIRARPSAPSSVG